MNNALQTLIATLTGNTNAAGFTTIELLGLVVSVVTLLVLVFGAWQGILVYRRQMNAQLLLAFTKRFDDLMTDFSNGADYPVDLFDSPPEPTHRLRAMVVRYLNLCSEEFYLHRRGYLSRDIWSIWEADMKETLKSELIRREWPEVRAVYRSFTEFQRFVDEQQETDKKSARHQT
jgi:hypothetical protein